jgi:tetratricopeptide (TPR) repeat protein
MSLANLLIEDGEFDRVRELLAGAEAAGVDPSELAIAKAALALAESRPADAKSLFDEELARDAITPQRATQWAALFVEREGLQSGLDVLEAAKARATDVGEKMELDLNQVALCLNAADIEKSRAMVERIAAAYPNEPRMSTRLNDSRVSIARALLMPGDRRDLPAAEALLAAIESTEPGRNDVKLVRARLLLNQEPPDLDGAESLSAEVRKKSDADPEAFLISSDIAYRKSQYANALDFAQLANTAAPDDPRTAMPLAQAQLQAGRFADAVLTLEKLKTMLPEDRAIMDLLARAYAGAGRTQEAEALARQIAAPDGGPKDVSLQAWILICRGDWGPASELLRQMQQANPDDLWSIHYLARAMEAQGQWDELETFLNDCVSRQPDSPNLWAELGNSYLPEDGSDVKLDPERLQKASFAFTQALVVRPEYSPALRGLLNVNLQSGELGAALGLCERFLVANPNDVAMLEKKATLLARLPGRREEALASIQRAIEITPRPEFFYVRGRLRLELGEFAVALEDFERVSQAGGVNRPDLEIAMAEACLGLNNVERAEIYYKSAKAKAANAAPPFAARLNEIGKRLGIKED